jgi:hypothetical protein
MWMEGLLRLGMVEMITITIHITPNLMKIIEQIEEELLGE